MITPYFVDESQEYYNDYYSRQVGEGLGYFSGSTVQKGSGIGSLLGSVFRKTLPLIKSGAAHIGKQLLSTGVNIARDALEGKDVKQSAGHNFKTAGAGLLTALSDSLGGRKQTKKRKAAPSKHKSKKKSKASASLFRDVKVSS